MNTKIRIFILSVVLLCGNMGCLVSGIFTAKELIYGIGVFGYVSKEILDFRHEKKGEELTERGLDLKEREIILKEEMFEESKVR